MDGPGGRTTKVCVDPGEKRSALLGTTDPQGGRGQLGHTVLKARDEGADGPSTAGRADVAPAAGRHARGVDVRGAVLSGELASATRRCRSPAGLRWFYVLPSGHCPGGSDSRVPPARGPREAADHQPPTRARGRPRQGVDQHGKMAAARMFQRGGPATHFPTGVGPRLCVGNDGMNAVIAEGAVLETAQPGARRARRSAAGWSAAPSSPAAQAAQQAEM